MRNCDNTTFHFAILLQVDSAILWATKKKKARKNKERKGEEGKAKMRQERGYTAKRKTKYRPSISQRGGGKTRGSLLLSYVIQKALKW